jgi:Xaa-Pro aminopeptidase
LRTHTLPIVFLGLFLVAVSDLPGEQETPQQKFFEWTRLQFDKEVYRGRRLELMDLVGKSGGGIVLVPSRHGRSNGETFRQLDDYLYFTGLELPDSVLTIDADQKKTILFAPHRDSRFENPSRRNDFPGRPLGEDPALAPISGIKDIRPLDTLDDFVTKAVVDKRAFRVNPDRPGPIPRYETDFIYDWNPTQQLAFHLQQNHPGIQIRNAYQEVARLRMIKSPEEIEAVRRACAVTAGAIREAAKMIRDGVDERSLEADLEAAFKRGGGQRVAFASIIKSGPNSLWPWRILAAHYDRRNRRMHDGELVIFDVGTELDYYVSDVGRTFPVSGKFTEEQKRVLEMVTSVVEAIIDAVKPGVTLGDLAAIAQTKIPPGERKYMQTGSYYGHHIGLSTGDPALMDAPLAPGMIFTVEPWYYNHDKEIAVFTEEVVVVTEGGAEVLTKMLPRSPEALEKMVGHDEDS